MAKKTALTMARKDAFSKTFIIVLSSGKVTSKHQKNKNIVFHS
jgi:hypothetical protein